jgi:hypothetical protein
MRRRRTKAWQDRGITKAWTTGFIPLQDQLTDPVEPPPQPQDVLRQRLDSHLVSSAGCRQPGCHPVRGRHVPARSARGLKDGIRPAPEAIWRLPHRRPAAHVPVADDHRGSAVDSEDPHFPRPGRRPRLALHRCRTAATARARRGRPVRDDVAATHPSGASKPLTGARKPLTCDRKMARPSWPGRSEGSPLLEARRVSHADTHHFWVSLRPVHDRRDVLATFARIDNSVQFVV